ncbi:MAG: alkaline phosphatase family protein [Candidatus Aureabacteria bacterium]|nr:alkaline phosphatase family protein [Candidatus Auribacterota bacterium]
MGNAIIKRVFILGAVALACLVQPGCGHRKEWPGQKKVIVLGFDGMDPRIVREMFAKGKLTNFKRLSEMGDFKNLWSSIPPQSPVAWSNFITGKNPGGHAVFDFIHRDPATYLPYLSTSETIPPRRTLKLGEYIMPISSGSVILKREGRAFWEYLTEAGIPAIVFRIPSNFPPVECGAKSVSGMGTPDLMGTYGIYQYYTTNAGDIPKDPSGAEFTLVHIADGAVRSSIAGPRNTYKKGSPKIEIDFTAWVDQEHRVARIDLPGQRVLLSQGEWSDWIVLSFPRMPLVSPVKGICRMYLKGVSPHFRLYVTPINIDPTCPALPIDTPTGYARGIADDVGYFYTQGMPENTKTLTNGTFTTDEFYAQFRMVLDENHRLFDCLFSKFRKGFFFYYYSSTDLGTHIFWHLRDKNHPVYDAAARERLGDVIENTYEEMDRTVGKVLARFDDQTTLIVMSDHGFSPYYKAFSLNTWLLRNGYLVLRDNATAGSLFKNIDWGRTRAYALGLNSLYINLRGREKYGIVEPGDEASALRKELKEKLEKATDPENGKRVVRRAHLATEVYSGPHVGRAPDILVGYDWGYRTSWESALGDVTADLLTVSREKWSGDHCGATEIVPGILFASKKIKLAQPHLYDIAPAILAEFGISKPADMVGTSIFEGAPEAGRRGGSREELRALPYQ